MSGALLIGSQCPSAHMGGGGLKWTPPALSPWVAKSRFSSIRWLQPFLVTSCPCKMNGRKLEKGVPPCQVWRTLHTYARMSFFLLHTYFTHWLIRYMCTQYMTCHVHTWACHDSIRSVHTILESELYKNRKTVDILGFCSFLEALLICSSVLLSRPLQDVKDLRKFMMIGSLDARSRDEWTQ